MGRGDGLRVEWPSSPSRPPAREPGREVDTLDLLGNLSSHQGDDGGHDVDEARRKVDRPGDRRGVRHPHDEGHPERALIDEEAVVQLAVLSEHLAVVPGDDDEGVVVEAEVAELLQDLAHAGVGEGHLPLVGVPAPLRGERLGRLVGVVGVVEVDEQEEGPVLVLVQPLPGEASRLVALALADVADLVHGLEAVVVAVEALAGAEPPVENEGADDGPRRVASGLEHLGQGQARVRQPVRQVVAEPVGGGQGPREQGDVGGQGHGHRGADLLEQHALPGHRVDVRRGRPREAVGAQAVRPKRVDADEEDVHRSAGPRAAGRLKTDEAQAEEDRVDEAGRSVVSSAEGADHRRDP